MSLASTFSSLARGALISLATAAVAFGAVAVFHPFEPAAAPSLAAPSKGAEAKALEGRIEALRMALRAAEANSAAPAAIPTADSASRVQFEAQIAAAAERRDLATRHAKSIRDALATGLAISSFAKIRDSVVIGQMLSQQAALDAQIAIEGTRLRANHPTMRALLAQSASLATQIRQEATNIAAALESEAQLDDKQVSLLQSQMPAQSAAIVEPGPPISGATLAAQRAELDQLVDTYFNIPPAATVTPNASRDPVTSVTLGAAILAGLAAAVMQIALAARRRRRAQDANIKAWREDHDPDLGPAPTAIVTETHRKAA